MSIAKILIVEDDAIINKDIELSVERIGYDVIASAQSGQEAITKAEKHQPDIVLMDIKLKGEMNGIEAAGIIRSRFNTPIIYLTAFAGEEELEKAKLTLPFGYLLKPVQEEDLKVNIKMALYTAKIESERMRAEKALKVSEQKYQDLYDHSSDMHVSVDAHTALIIDCNQTLINRTGFSKEKLIGHSIFKLYAPESIDYVKKYVFPKFVKTGKIEEELLLRSINGSLIEVSLNASAVRDSEGNILFSRSSFRDITAIKRVDRERQELERQILHGQKMESLGTLASGIAHDFNNLLFQILGFTQLIKKKFKDNEEAITLLKPIETATKRAADLVKQVLTYSRSTSSKIRPVAIQPLIKEILKLSRGSFPTTIDIRQKIDPECRSALVDPTKIYQVVMNLCTNANQAMLETGGILEVALTGIEIDSENSTFGSGLKPGRYLELKVSDTGHGMDEKTQKKIFSPFFTTKGTSGGTGMGLPNVKRIVEEHKGSVSVSSTLGKGTTIKVLLPETDIIDRAIVEPSDKEIQGGTESIIIVDDEHSSVAMLQAILSELGYNISGFSSSLDALKAFQTSPNIYDLVITDQTMPQMTGAELSVNMMKIRSDIPIIMITGYSEIINEEQAIRLGIRKFLLKPVAIEKLAVSIREVLGGKNSDHR